MILIWAQMPISVKCQFIYFLTIFPCWFGCCSARRISAGNSDTLEHLPQVSMTTEPCFYVETSIWAFQRPANGQKKTSNESRRRGLPKGEQKGKWFLFLNPPVIPGTWMDRRSWCFWRRGCRSVFWHKCMSSLNSVQFRNVCAVIRSFEVVLGSVC